jgi:hypothetical protein
MAKKKEDRLTEEQLIHVLRMAAEFETANHSSPDGFSREEVLRVGKRWALVRRRSSLLSQRQRFRLQSPLPRQNERVSL